MGETRVDLQHLLEDLRDAYTGPLEESIVTELVANALDAGASAVRMGLMPILFTRGERPDAALMDDHAWMFRIANEPHPDIRSFAPDLPDCLVAIIDKALTKDADQRYQTGAELAADLRTCIGMAGGAATGGTDIDIGI